MFVDLSGADTQSVRADIAIVGTGATGLSMAMHLVRAGATVAMFETGGFERTQSAEELSNAKVSGSLPVWIRTRSRFLGGSTNCWGGNNSPLDPVDFDRDWVPHAKWPIGASDLTPHAAEVHELFGLGVVDFSIDYWKNRLARLKDAFLFEDSDRITTKIVQKTHVGHLGQVLEWPIEQSDKITVYLNAQITNIVTNSDGTEVTGMQAQSLDGARLVNISADSYVLAAGPENPRLLLASQDQSPAGVGNTFDQVGRYWIAHHSALRGWMEPSPDLDWDLYHMVPKPIGEQRIFASLQISEYEQRKRKLLNSAANFEVFRPHASFNTRLAAVASLKHRLGKDTIPLAAPKMSPKLAAEIATDTAKVVGRLADKTGRKLRGRQPQVMIRNWAEQFPHPDNRVHLSDATDRFGTPLMTVTSNLQPEDRETLHLSFETFAEEFERFGYGRWHSDFPTGTQWPAGSINTSHFMGGTRMSDKPEDGVVDTHGQVHGVSNLFIAGGSVFPTAGVSMVTYTAVLLALRTADRIVSTSSKSPIRANPETRTAVPTDVRTVSPKG